MFRVPARATFRAPRHGTRRAVLAAALALAAALTGCAAETGNRAATRSGDPQACPGEVVDVVVSVSQWSDLVDTVGGACATVTTVVVSGSVDPHEFEPTAGDIAAFADADLVVLNGLGYDAWAADAIAGLAPAPTVVEVAGMEVAGMEVAGTATGHGTADPHLWYDPVIVEETAAAVVEALDALSPDAAPTFAAGARAWRAATAPYRAALARLQSVAGGHSYAATEPVFSRTARAVGLTDATPEGFLDAVAGGGEPVAADLAAIEATLERVDVLVVNAQTAGALPDQVRAVAEDIGVPVVEVTESPPDGVGSFVAWQTRQLRAVTAALGRAR